MRKLLFLILFLLAISTLSSGQDLGMDIFNNPPEAAGNLVIDVPPDILLVEMTPQEPSEVEPVKVRAIIAVDKYMSAFKVKQAFLRFTTNGENFTTLLMKLVDEERSLFEAEIPPQKKGSEVSFYLAGFDEIGNCVIELAPQKEMRLGEKEGLREVLKDEDNSLLKVKDSADILSISFGLNGENLFGLEEFRGNLRPRLSKNEILLYGLGTVAHDLREKPYCSQTEIVTGVNYIAYIPLMGKKGLYRLDDIARDKPSQTKVNFKVNQNELYFSLPLKDLTDQPERGLKVFSVTASINLATQELSLIDGSPYSIIYFKGHSYMVNK